MNSSEPSTAQAASQASSPNGVHALLGNTIKDVDALEKLNRQALKLKLADHARLMADNQRLLNTTTEDDRALRQQRHRFREMQLLAAASGSGLEFPQDDGGQMDINIDSPTTITNHYPEQAKTGLLRKALPWVVAGAIGLGTGGLGWMLGGIGKAPTPPTFKGDGNTSIKLVE